jgi:methyltransferase
VVTDSHLAFTLLVAAVAAARLLELRVSNRNVRRLTARGGVEAAPRHYPAMVGLHTAFLAACPAEAWLLDRPFLPWLGWPMVCLVLAAAGLRLWVIRTLDGRWTTRIICLPGAPPVTTGPYRFLRHPNYLAVIVEIFALPLVHTAWLSAAAFSAANAQLLRVRIRAEEAALAKVSPYETAFSGRYRLVPGGR